MPDRQLPPPTAPGPLLPWLVAALAPTNRTRVKQLLQHGRIVVNGRVVTRHDHALAAGDHVAVAAEGTTERPDATPPLIVQYEDPHLIIVDKPAGLLSVATDTEKGHTAFSRLSAMLTRRKAGRPFVVGPYINVFNEGARDFLVGCGAVRIVLPVEMPAKSIAVVAGGEARAEYEVQVFGRQPLSVAMRCYHARAHDRSKDHCQLVCGLDADGLTARTIDGSDILTINGTQTLTHGHAVLLAELESLHGAGVRHFRLSPQDLDMVAVARLYREVLDGRRTPDSALAALRALTGEVPFVNGFLHGREGLAWTNA